jgi:acylphosphatase
MARAHVLVSGKVQGVFYRDSTRQKAESLGLAGWVRNLRDGRVEAVFEGPEDAVKDAVAWCREGSPNARVTDVDVLWTEPEEKLEGFEVRATA